MSQPSLSPPSLLSTVARGWHWASGPVNLLMLAWLFSGRALAGAPMGWMTFILMTAGLPVVVAPIIWLTARGYQYRRLSQTVTLTQAFLYAALWFAMFVCGAAIVDFADQGGQGSALTQWFGADLADQSHQLAQLSGVGTILVMICLGIALRVERDRPVEHLAVGGAARSQDDGQCAAPRNLPPPLPLARPRPRRHRGRTAWMYAHMRLFAALMLLWNAPTLLPYPMLTTIITLGSLVPVYGAYRRRRGTRRLTVVQYRLVVTILLSLAGHGCLPYLWRWDAVYVPLWLGASILAICAGIALGAANAADAQELAGRSPRDVVRARVGLPGNEAT